MVLTGNSSAEDRATLRLSQWSKCLTYYIARNSTLTVVWRAPWFERPLRTLYEFLYRLHKWAAVSYTELISPPGADYPFRGREAQLWPTVESCVHLPHWVGPSPKRCSLRDRPPSSGKRLRKISLVTNKTISPLMLVP